MQVSVQSVNATAASLQIQPRAQQGGEYSTITLPVTIFGAI